MFCIPRMSLLPHGERNEIFRRASESLKTPLAGGPQCDWRRPLWSKRRGSSRKVCLNLLLLWKCRQPVAFRCPDVHILALIRSWLPVKWTENWAPWERLQHQHSMCPIWGVCACEAACMRCQHDKQSTCTPHLLIFCKKKKKKLNVKPEEFPSFFFFVYFFLVFWGGYVTQPPLAASAQGSCTVQKKRPGN